jgi:hypothetical protein
MEEGKRKGFSVLKDRRKERIEEQISEKKLKEIIKERKNKQTNLKK